ncbi:hypothetical protein KY345_01690 [Candidatus Woesearchaeota archaeon]|nr:hypothetical protein [Candidatus Woesearchaeota archaeon]
MNSDTSDGNEEGKILQFRPKNAADAPESLESVMGKKDFGYKSQAPLDPEALHLIHPDHTTHLICCVEDRYDLMMRDDVGYLAHKTVCDQDFKLKHIEDKEELDKYLSAYFKDKSKQAVTLLLQDNSEFVAFKGPKIFAGCSLYSYIKGGRGVDLRLFGRKSLVNGYKKISDSREFESHVYPDFNVLTLEKMPLAREVINAIQHSMQ